VRPSATPAGLTSFVAPTSCAQYQPRLSEYLTRNRCLPANIVTHVMNLGLVYPDSRRNAVFLCHAPSGDVTGAELRGTGSTPFKGMSPGSRRGAGFFTLLSKAPTELVVVESALDALAYQALFATSAACIVSTAGVMPECPALLKLAEKLGVEHIAIAYDNDTAGEAASERLVKSLAVDGRTVRRRLPKLKDWNDILIAGGQEGTQRGDADQASLLMEVF